MADDREPELLPDPREPPPREVTRFAARPPPDRPERLAVHLQRHLHLHPRARRGRRPRPRPGRSVAPRGHSRRGRRETIETILVTHTHRDHSALAGRLRDATGARIVGAAPFKPAGDGKAGLDSSHDRAYAPDAVLADGERFVGQDFTLETVATPGHCANHLAFALIEEEALFSGDHVMAWSTSVVAPPDGSMGAYMASLEKVRARSERTYWPGHGGPVTSPGATSGGWRCTAASARPRSSPRSRRGPRPFRIWSLGSTRASTRSLPGRRASPHSPISWTSRSGGASRPSLPAASPLAASRAGGGSDGRRASRAARRLESHRRPPGRTQAPQPEGSRHLDLLGFSCHNLNVSMACACAG